MIKIAFHILTIIIAIYIVIEDEYLDMIVNFSLFSLFVTVIYFLNYAPDVAIAEIAVGAALVPIMFLISISKQRQFIVAGDLDENFFSSFGKENKILRKFCNIYDLDLKFIKDLDEESIVMTGVFRKVNVDIYVKKREGLGYFLIGKEASILMRRLDQMTRQDPEITVILAPDLDVLGGDG